MGDPGGCPCHDRGGLRKRPDRDATAGTDGYTDSNTTAYGNTNSAAAWRDAASDSDADCDSTADTDPRRLVRG